MSELIREFAVPIGLSDHSMNIWTCLGAVALGASVLEKHFTISRAWPGPDTGISIEPQELKDLVEGSRAVWLARGGGKTVLAEEKPVIDFAYATVVSIAPIAAGEVFGPKNVWGETPPEPVRFQRNAWGMSWVDDPSMIFQRTSMFELRM